MEKGIVMFKNHSRLKVGRMKRVLGEPKQVSCVL